MCQQREFELDRRISKRFIRTQCFGNNTRSLREYSPVLKELKKENIIKHHEEILTVEVISVPSWGERFSLTSTVFSLVSSRTFRDVPHSRFRRRVPKQWLTNFLKMLL